jgi:hypothetical protein
MSRNKSNREGAGRKEDWRVCVRDLAPTTASSRAALRKV